MTLIELYFFPNCYFKFQSYCGYFVDTSSAGLLKQAVLPVVNVDKCNSTDYLDGDATDNMICAGYDKGGIDSCQVTTAFCRQP